MLPVVVIVISGSGRISNSDYDFSNEGTCGMVLSGPKSSYDVPVVVVVVSLMSCYMVDGVMFAEYREDNGQV